MLRCTRCEGFVPADLSSCPNCTKFVPRGRAVTGFLAVLGAGAAAITLMACYGMPVCEHTLSDGGTSTTCSPEPKDAGPADAGQDAGVCDGGTNPC